MESTPRHVFSFDEHFFLSPSSSSDAVSSLEIRRFIRRSRHSTPLPTLAQDLRQFSSRLKADLVALLNNEVDVFLSLSSALQDLPQDCLRIIQATQALDQVLDPAHSSINELAEKIKQTHSDKNRILKRRKELHDIVDAINRVDAARSAASHTDLEAINCSGHVELAVIEAMSPGDNQPNLAGARFVRRSFSLIRALRAVKSARCKAEPLIAIRIIGQKLKELENVEEELDGKLREFLVQAVEFSGQCKVVDEAVVRVVKACVFAEKVILVRQVLQNRTSSMVQHIFEEIFSSQDAGGNFSSVEQKLQLALKNLLQKLQDDLGKFLAALTTLPLSIQKTVDLIGEAVWEACAQGLYKLGALIFTPGMPDTLHANHAICMNFLNDFAAEFVSEAELMNAFICHHSVQSFKAKWNLPVYFKLRSHQILSSLEKSLQLPLTMESSLVSGEVSTDHSLPSSQFSLRQFRDISLRLTDCWNNKIWMEDLSVEFVELFFKIIDRVCEWILQGLGLESAEQVPTLFVDDNGAQYLKGRWSTKDLHLMLLLISDMELLLGQRNEILNSVLGQLKMEQSCMEAVVEGIESSFLDLGDSLPLMYEYVSLKIILDAEVVLKLGIPKIKTVYRVSSKVPTQASPYIEEALQALFRLRDLMVELKFSSETRAEIEFRVIKGIVSLARDLMLDLLDVTRKTEATLQRLHNSKSLYTSLKGQHGRTPSIGGNEKETVSYAELIQAQVKLDIQELIQKIQNASVITLHQLRDITQFCDLEAIL